MTKKKGGELEIIARQFGFARDQLSAVADRMERAGFGDLAGEVRLLAGSAQFFLGEFERERGNAPTVEA
ncbi:hypothetical protein [Azospirillum argentinense]|nr:hypothetical protein [Azospirillum argentinense]